MEAILKLFSNPAFSGLLGVVIGGVLTYLFSVRLEKRRNFNAIAERFRKAFADEVTALRYTNEDPANILSDSFIKHEAAVFELKHVLSRRKRKCFKKSWIEYNPGVQHPGNHEPPSMSQYFSMQSPGIDPEEVRTLAIKRIENLLRFAKPNDILSSISQNYDNRLHKTMNLGTTIFLKRLGGLINTLEVLKCSLKRKVANHIDQA